MSNMNVLSADNGGRSETLSKKQAEEIIRKANSCNEKVAKRIEKRVNEFLEDLSPIWEDENAVAFVKGLKETTEKIVEQLRKNNGTFGETVAAIATKYIILGGMGMAIAAPVAPAIIANIDISKIKKFFGDTENSDDFGFRNIDSGPEEVMTAFNALKMDIEKIAIEGTEEMNNINAFGNIQVKSKLIKSAEKIVEIVEENINSTEFDIKESVAGAIEKYKQVGSIAIEKSHLDSNVSN